MINFSELPREPVPALSRVLLDALALIPVESENVSTLVKNNQQIFDRLVILLKAAQIIAARIGDDEFLELAKRNLYIRQDEVTGKARQRVSSVISALHIFEMDRHFIGADETAEFDQAEIPKNEREEIRSSLQRARDLAATANFLSDQVRRSFLHKVSLAESELFKEKVGFQAFLAAAYEGSRLLKRYGEAAKPLAEAIEKARTKTERHVHGYEQIGMDEKPKQLPKPDQPGKA